jgi:hypothetical protein
MAWNSREPMKAVMRVILACFVAASVSASVALSAPKEGPAKAATINFPVIFICRSAPSVWTVNYWR